jgi:GNAT superfamily N-acetyltransferase
MTICLAQNSADIAGIMTLQKANLPTALTAEAQQTQGFVTVAHTVEVLTQMNDLTPSVIVKNEDGAVVAYCLAMLHSFGLQIPELVPLFELIDNIEWQGKPLGDTVCVYCGQICIDKNYRGEGYFQAMYDFFKATYAPIYPYMITEIAARNTRSLRAHSRTGFEEIHRYTAPDGENWVVVLWQWS